MTEQENVQAVQGLYAAFQRGDFTIFLNTLADGVEWFVPGPQPILPWAGLRKGRERVAQFFTEYAQTAEVQQFEPRAFIAQGERVVVLGYRRDRVKATGRSFESEWAQAFSLGGFSLDVPSPLVLPYHVPALAPLSRRQSGVSPGTRDHGETTELSPM
ncbi:MAG: nuclear transport factor 2 family protein [Thermodesulfobacteriota bacterium]|jgi:ketosteroid isomerase-like protein